MNLLILTCDTGEGHNSAAKSVANVCERRGIRYTIADPLSFGGKPIRAIVTSSYNTMIRHTPRTWSMIYHGSELLDKTKIKSPLMVTDALCEKRLAEFIIDNHFDAVLCCHIFAMSALSAIRKKRKLNIPSFGIITDYTCYPFLKEISIDRFFLPHKDLIQPTAENGTSKDSLVAYGIPVSEKFTKKIGKDAARNYLVIPQDSKMFLIMSGSVGCGKIDRICKELLKNDDSNFRVTVLIGRNDELREKLEKKFPNEGRLQIVGFTDKVNLYMEAADLMITKPGGLTITEAINIGIPMVLLTVFKGNEDENADFFSARELGLRAEDPKDAARKSLRLIENPILCERMITIQSESACHDSAERILSDIESNLNRTGENL